MLSGEGDIRYHISRQEKYDPLNILEIIWSPAFEPWSYYSIFLGSNTEWKSVPGIMYGEALVDLYCNVHQEDIATHSDNSQRTSRYRRGVEEQKVNEGRWACTPPMERDNASQYSLV